MGYTNASHNEQIEKSFKYHPPKGDQASRYESLRHMSKALAHDINNMCPNSAEKTIALRKLEEALMWANKSIAVNETHGEVGE